MDRRYCRDHFSPGNNGDENLAFFLGRAFGDFEAEFEFRWDVVWTHAGFIFRASDARHYYMVHFPVNGQQYRVEGFWAAISKVDENGFFEIMSMQLVHGVSSGPKLWHQVRLAVSGSEIRLWVDGRPLPVANDTTYSHPGYVGLSTYGSLGGGPKSSFRNVRICGRSDPGPDWDVSVRPQRN